MATDDGDSTAADAKSQEDGLRQIEAQWRASAEKRFGSEIFPELERAWAAGFWDGEGHARALSGGGAECSVDNTDKLAVERFQKAVGGVGSITSLSPRVGKKWKPTYRWRATNHADIEKVAVALIPFLMEAKRKQFAQALAVPIKTAIEHERKLPPGTASSEKPIP